MGKSKIYKVNFHNLLALKRTVSWVSSGISCNSSFDCSKYASCVDFRGFQAIRNSVLPEIVKKKIIKTKQNPSILLGRFWLTLNNQNLESELFLKVEQNEKIVLPTYGLFQEENPKDNLDLCCGVIASPSR